MPARAGGGTLGSTGVSPVGFGVSPKRTFVGAIIGYNEKSHEILYSDSWGFGHELKRMPLAQAWTISTGLDAIEPL